MVDADGPGPAAAPGNPGWRPMQPADLPAVIAIAARVHRDHPERPAVFAERLALAPEGCLALAADGGAAAPGLLGYALTHPWAATHPPALDTLLGALPEAPGCWHLHDIALLPAARGRGHAARVLDRILGLAAARGLAQASLVAVAGKAAYWTRHGFRPTDADGEGLSSYGPGAVFMRRPLPRPTPPPSDCHRGTS